MHIAAILVAAGRGTRLGLDVPKAFAPLHGQSLFLYAARSLSRAPLISSLFVVTAAEYGDTARQLLSQIDAAVPIDVVAGGAERQDSVAAGVAAASAADLILVHDAARPFVTQRCINDCIAAAGEYGAAIAALPCTDTVKQADAQHIIAATLDRATLWLAQTPQIARADWLRAALRRAATDNVVATDEAGLLERCGYQVRVVPGDGCNRKLTTPEDLQWAEWFAQTQLDRNS